MTNHPVEPGGDAGDLLGRWLAHHDTPADQDAPPQVHPQVPRRVPSAARPSEAAAAARATRPSAAAVLAELRATSAPVPDERPRDVAPASAPGRRRLPGSARIGPGGNGTGKRRATTTSDPVEPDRPSTADFEPVILRSVRSKAESKDDEDRGSRGPLSRLRARVGGTSDPEPEPEPAPAGDPVTEAPVEPPPALPVRRPAGRRRAEPVDEEPAEPRPTGPRTGDAVRTLLMAARSVPATVVAPPPVEPVAEPEPEPTPAPPMEMPAVYAFAPLKSSRRFLSMMLIAGLVLSGFLGYTAFQSRDSIQIGVAAIATVATLVIWAIRAGATVTRLTVRSGQLEITRQGGRVVFDLASSYTGIEVVGRPGSKTWKVLFQRSGQPPVVVDSSMVDGRDFMRILAFFRPDLA